MTKFDIRYIDSDLAEHHWILEAEDYDDAYAKVEETKPHTIPDDELCWDYVRITLREPLIFKPTKES